MAFTFLKPAAKKPAAKKPAAKPAAKKPAAKKPAAKKTAEKPAVKKEDAKKNKKHSDFPFCRGRAAVFPLLFVCFSYRFRKRQGGARRPALRQNH